MEASLEMFPVNVCEWKKGDIKAQTLSMFGWVIYAAITIEDSTSFHDLASPPSTLSMNKYDFFRMLFSFRVSAVAVSMIIKNKCLIRFHAPS